MEIESQTGVGTQVRVLLPIVCDKVADATVRAYGGSSWLTVFPPLQPARMVLVYSS
jgi:hypothetical protein